MRQARRGRRRSQAALQADAGFGAVAEGHVEFTMVADRCGVLWAWGVVNSTLGMHGGRDAPRRRIALCKDHR